MVVFCLSFWTVRTPKSKRNPTKELLNETDSGVLKTQVWFHITLTSASAPASSSRQTHTTRRSSTFTVTSAGEESEETNRKKFSCFSSQAFCFSVSAPLIFLLTLFTAWNIVRRRSSQHPGCVRECVCVLTDGCHCMRAGLHIHIMEAENHSKHMQWTAGLADWN